MSKDMSAQDYGVSQVETVCKGTDVIARIFTLSPGQEIEWHYHTECHDNFFVLEGSITVAVGDAGHLIELGVGMKHDVPPKEKHVVRNLGGADARFLLVQGVGEYDFVKTNP